MTNLTPKNDIVKIWPAIMFGKRMERGFAILDAKFWRKQSIHFQFNMLLRGFFPTLFRNPSWLISTNHWTELYSIFLHGPYLTRTSHPWESHRKTFLGFRKSSWIWLCSQNLRMNPYRIKNWYPTLQWLICKHFTMLAYNMVWVDVRFANSGWQQTSES